MLHTTPDDPPPDDLVEKVNKKLDEEWERRNGG